MLSVATSVFGRDGQFRDYRLPQTATRIAMNPVSVHALWTRDELRPRWNNLAAVADVVSDDRTVSWWEQLVAGLSIPLALLIESGRYLLLSFKAQEARITPVFAEQLRAELETRRDELFAPRALGRLRTNQLLFADLEETVSERGFTFLSRQRTTLEKALKEAVASASSAESEQRHKSRKAQFSHIAEPSVYETVLSVATAYLAARILEDKGFFGPNRLPTNDPEKLLKETVSKRNGFFRKVLDENLPNLSTAAQQYLALHLGANVTFSLVDHRDVGHLYEQALVFLQSSWASEEKEAKQGPLLDLQRHYTPVAIADKMLDFLPLERLRPDERKVIDLAHGSGSLLLSATRRLSSMPDIPTGSDRAKYLKSSVAGNDIDGLAALVTRLRYILAQESVGREEIFPTPTHLAKQDYTSYTKGRLPIRARVWTANPPFAEDEGTQRAFKFVEMVTEWMEDGDQFAFILPQSFLSGTTYGAPNVRQALSRKANILETWQLPEGVVGLSALQQVCVVLGVVGLHNRNNTIARAIISRRNKAYVRDEGFLGTSWVADTPVETDDWGHLLAPKVRLSVPTVELGEMYYVFTGVNPDFQYPPVPTKPKGVPCKRYWRLNWREQGRLWADPERVDPDERYIRYGKEYLEGARLKNAPLFDKMKLFVAHSMNRDTKDPLAAHLDTTGLCPNVHVFCICSRLAANKPVNSQATSRTWRQLVEKEKLLWLLGILSSQTARDISFGGREPRHLPAVELKKFPLPARIDSKIIRITERIILRDQAREEISFPDPLRQELDHVVADSYGNPAPLNVNITDSSHQIVELKDERKHHAVIVTGQVLRINSQRNKVHLYLDGIADDKQEAWLPMPQQMPSWALDGEVFTADLSSDVSTFADLRKRPWALRRFRHSPRPYLSATELEQEFMTAAQKE
jgi:hypothetical protein